MMGLTMADDVRYGLAGRFFRSAIYSVREAVQIENAATEAATAEYLARIGIANNEMGFAIGSQDPHWPEHAHRTHVCSAILYGASSVEATANHILADAAERATDLRYLGDHVLGELAKKWSDCEVRRCESALDKIQLILTTCELDPFDCGQNPFQDVATLFSLRNALVHFVPEWASRQEAHAKIEARLRSKNLKGNPFAPAHAPVFPGKCLSADLATWSVVAVYRLIAEFYKRIAHEGAIRSWDRYEYYIREFGNWEAYARWEGGGGPPWRQ